ncbi:unnamed protein product [Vitrella brassicaformis CCMP3155]|uniref:Major facilitator superfamily (MFS) profile domain-containing protein n=1 Tax=Vitrella brassicaformis (strain CCMP3155) TaxID=1169540 RepID=A0A0G4EL14_VITBC|nr:unnamed protein product [Vitrella brassicaformis CCMP3155]|eukprot:CEL97679.1 unnamed protein product [Vitrella brassicaformis CCMP3155]
MKEGKTAKDEEARPVPREILWVYLALFLELVGAGASLPILPFFALEDLNASPFQLGVMYSLYSLAQMVGSFVFGRLSDSLGRRPIVLTAYLWSAIGFFLTGCSSSVWQLTLSRAFAGLSGGSISMTSAIIADFTDTTTRPKYMGIFGATIGLAFAIGPGVGGAAKTALESRPLLFFLCSIMCFGAFVLSVVLIPESLPKAQRRPLRLLDRVGEAAPLLSAEGDMEVGDRGAAGEEGGVNYVGLLMVFGARFLTSFTTSLMTTCYSILFRETYKEQFGQLDRALGMFLTVLALVMCVYQGSMYPKLVKKFGKHRIIHLGCFSLGVGVLLIFFSTRLPTYLHLLAICTLYAWGSSMVEPGLPTLAASYADAKHQGFAQGSLSSFRFLAFICGPSLFGYLYKEVSPAAPFWVAGVAGMLAATLTTAAERFGCEISDEGASREGVAA